MTDTISQIDFLKKFNSESDCIKFLEDKRWGGVPISPFDKNSKVYSCSGDKYKCKNSNKYFNVRTGTIFDNSKIPLTNWFFLIYCQALNLKNISSRQNAKNYDVTQKTMWAIMHKIRSVLKQDNSMVLMGTIEIDECFVSKGNKWTRWGGISTRKAPILGMVEREGRVIIKTIEDRTRATILSEIQKHIAEGSTIYTDGHPSYKTIKGNYFHDYVEHSTHEYVRGDVHTNTIENIWSQFKKSIRYAHHSVSEKHIQSYCDEVAWRHNNRHLTGAQKFNKMLELCLSTLPLPIDFSLQEK